MQNQYVLIIDFGSQYSQLIARSVRKLGVYCEVKPSTITLDEIKSLEPVGIILSGESNKDLSKLGIPTLESKTLVEDNTLKAFLYDTCGCIGDWTMTRYIENQIKEIRDKVGNGKALCALSGGVDSSVCAALMSKAIGSQLTCVFVDTGLMRKNEGDEVEAAFSKA